MIRYSLPSIVIPRVIAGTALQTFQGPQERHARPGERIELVDDTAQRQIIPPPLCTALVRCEILWFGNRITRIRENGVALFHLDKFAQACGYSEFEELEGDFVRRFKPTYMEGFLIEWVPPSAAPTLAVA